MFDWNNLTFLKTLGVVGCPALPSLMDISFRKHLPTSLQQVEWDNDHDDTCYIGGRTSGVCEEGPILANQISALQEQLQKQPKPFPLDAAVKCFGLVIWNHKPSMADMHA
ncbi:bifunctional dihydrofolate reductase-thymidylate synthase-like protein [Corchorus olitorius]|uniref:Bifunctional dihydrofolate reductase-thymidylate synthase-like protein n=1 Tax=Corchorus olitorius TaxID=93759 RepID=A0A1R3KN05_9ROSI|nr:bifunctional dihydrofolate reductase-thymidylate synthase-like protein [Corchorus olitorius]